MRFHFKHILINEKYIDYYCYGKQNPHQKKNQIKNFWLFTLENFGVRPMQVIFLTNSNGLFSGRFWRSVQ